jgi:isoprenylcysteine carboxyl methyltransferase (ICMT) family protein YpbQ
MVSFSILINIIGELVSSIEVISTVWAFMSFVLSFAVIQPLVAVWFTRLYLNRNDREIYDVSDLLDYP